MSWEKAMEAWLPLVPAFMLALCVHESAFALVARWRGDDTAARQGRISLFPPRQLALYESLLLPLLCLFLIKLPYGTGKPVPVDPGKLRRPKADFSLVAVSGPLANLLLAMFGLLALKAAFIWAPEARPLLLFFSTLAWISLLLGLLYLLPLPGFDGLKALYVFLPDEWCWKLSRSDRFGVLYLALLAMIGGLKWVDTLVQIMMQGAGRLLGIPL